MSIRYHLGGCHLYVHEFGVVRHLASARTVPIALTALGLGPGPGPGRGHDHDQS
ncbi:hypothetical protein [Micromonospora sonneratiae]|uniref:Uncharacterized protein n=1 Tax=Micromonospora sonneratiae TaxID=1184706 RepID=A0ABW3YCV1_9ACTN